MTTTYRLLRQTSRTSRFAAVTVEVEPSSVPEVEVTAAVTAAHRREADLGARWGLRGLPAAAKVTVTDVLTTESTQLRETFTRPPPAPCGRPWASNTRHRTRGSAPPGWSHPGWTTWRVDGSKR